MVALCDRDAVLRDFFACVRGTAVGCQMEMALSAYGQRDPQTAAWTVYSTEGTACGGIVSSAGSLFVCLCRQEGAKECADFLHFLFPGRPFSCDGKTEEFLTPCGFGTVQSGDVLRFHGQPQRIPMPAGYHFPQEIRSDKLYALLCTCFEGFGENHPWEAFAADLFLKRKAGAQVLGLAQGNTLCACAGIYALVENTALLSAVAALPGHRGKGLARFLVSSLCMQQQCWERRVLVMTQTPSLSRFYEDIGFISDGRWAVLKEKERSCR